MKKAETPPERKSKTRKRDIIWYNPPFNQAVTTNLGKQFLDLIKKHFPKSNPLSRIINRNTVKLSYSCTKNMGAILKSHNMKILSNTREDNGAKTCNCRKKDQCPLENNCLQKNVVYHA